MIDFGNLGQVIKDRKAFCEVISRIYDSSGYMIETQQSQRMMIDALFLKASKMNQNEAGMYTLFYVVPLFIQFLNEGHAFKYACITLCLLYRSLYFVLYYKLNSRKGLNDWSTR